MNPTDQPDVWLARFAKLAVLGAFVVIFIGGLTTTTGSGMAFPDWPLSHGSLNPPGWWDDAMQRREHLHRYSAEAVAVLVGVLCAWIWGANWAMPIAASYRDACAVGREAGRSARLSWRSPAYLSAALTFVIIILKTRYRCVRITRGFHDCPMANAFGAFLGVLAQAVLGGLRVLKDPAGVLAGDANTATIFRIVHGCFAQLELCLLVIIAAMLSPVWPRIAANAQMRLVHGIGWITTAFVFLQLAVGATMRHLGAGLAIPTFPHTPDGGWMPLVHNLYVDLNFTHTRFGAALAVIFILALALRARRERLGDVHLIRPAALLLALAVAQVTMGIYVILERAPTYSHYIACRQRLQY